MLRPSKRATVTFTLHESLASLGIALAGGHMPSVAKAIMDHSEIAEMVFQLYLDKVEMECSNEVQTLSFPQNWC